MNSKIEILAPAGSYESMVGAINGGADAVYMGGQLFGARAYANNPDQQLLCSAIDYVHLHGKKLYLTVNTLVKENELKKQLFSYLEPLYVQGLDAVIVQDMGALAAIREWFPQLDIHASTQMTVVSKDHARFLKDMGVCRIVPARELSLAEISALKQAFGGEIECFVHGALCYCYSGQCLFSSMLGGRSGNRGRCAQPCRLPYELLENGQVCHKSCENYLLSPKDICVLDLIPDLCEAGVDSFKIEGRMKKPEYAAFVSHIYRKYADIYEQSGRENYHVDAADRRALMDLYNRGGFSDGYYRVHNGRAMMSLARPNHYGTPVAKVAGQKDGMTVLDVHVPLNTGDVLLAQGLADKDSVTLKSGCLPGKKCSVRFGSRLKSGTTVVRLRNESLLTQIKKDFLDFAVDETGHVSGNGKKQEKIYVSLTLLKDLPAKMQLIFGDTNVCVTGDIVAAAQNQPLSRDSVAVRIAKTGNTPFVIEKLDIEMDKDIYMPVQAQNQLRRDGLAALENAVLHKYRRSGLCERCLGECMPETDVQQLSDISPDSAGFTAACAQSALISEPAMADTVLEFGQIKRIYLESWLIDMPNLMSMIQKIHKKGVACFMALPHIFRDQSRLRWETLLRLMIAENDHRQLFDGFLIRNMESLAFIKDMKLAGEIVADYHLYSMNCKAAKYYQQQGINVQTLPVELNGKELRIFKGQPTEMVAYGYLPLMTSAQCLIKTTKKCLAQADKKNMFWQLKDRYGKKFAVRPVCSECYNLIYNSQPLMLYDLELKNIDPKWLRYQFTYESSQEIRQILSGKEMPAQTYTRGHFNRGVE